MRLPRFTTRRLMVLVAVAALASGWVSWDFRMRRLSVFYNLKVLEYTECGGPNPRFPTAVRRDPPSALERWNADMAEKYRRAARYPWLPVPPDPPPPE